MIAFAAGNDASQTLGAWMCWQRWCWEEQGRDLDHEAWLAQQQHKVSGGAYLQVIGWDTGEPVAMLEVIVVYDPMRRIQIGHADKAWVHPNYRQAGTFAQICEFTMDAMRLIGVECWVAPVTAGKKATAPWLRAMYERFGFELAGLTLVRDRRAA